MAKIAWRLVVCRIPMVTSLIFSKLRWVLPERTLYHPSMTISFSLTFVYKKIFIRSIFKNLIRQQDNLITVSISAFHSNLRIFLIVKNRFVQSTNVQGNFHFIKKNNVRLWYYLPAARWYPTFRFFIGNLHFQSTVCPAGQSFFQRLPRGREVAKPWNGI